MKQQIAGKKIKGSFQSGTARHFCNKFIFFIVQRKWQDFLKILCFWVHKMWKLHLISQTIYRLFLIFYWGKYYCIVDLNNIKDREIGALSGGELQRFACAMVCIQDGDIFMFDEPSSYLDVKQRLNAARTIRSLLHPSK